MRYFYWPPFKDKPLYVDPKYKDLKEEMLKHLKDVTEWNIMAEKADEFLKTDKIKSIVPGELHGRFIKVYGLNPAMQFTSQHMIAMLFYTDYTDLTTQFCQTFRKLSNNETLEQLKDRNSAFAHWSKALRESVEVFGENMDARKRVYHGINTRLLFRDTIVTFCSPTSTTVTPAIAENFADDNGMVLTLRKYDSIHCWDVSGISKFTWEDELLFIGGFHGLRIISVFVNNVKHDNTSAVPVITTLRELLAEKGKDILKPQSFAWLVGLIEYSMNSVNGSEQKLESNDINTIAASPKWNYSLELWKCWSESIHGTITINLDFVVNRYAKLLNALTEKCFLFKTVKRCDNNVWIEPNSLCAIWPNIQKIFIKNSKINKADDIIALLKELSECEFINSQCCKLRKVMVEIENVDNKLKEIIKSKAIAFGNWSLKCSRSKKQISVKSKKVRVKSQNKLQEKTDEKESETQTNLNRSKDDEKEVKEEEENANNEEEKNQIEILLEKWNLKQYVNVLITEEGYEDIEDCFDLTLEELKTIGFKTGHAKKFMRLLKEWRDK